MTDQREAVDVHPAKPAPTLILTLGVAAACWLIAVARMRGMDMGVATTLGSFPSFLALWTVMMAAMMLPGAVPAALRHARSADHGWTALAFLAEYVAVWAAFGVAAYPGYRPHSTAVAGAAALVAAAYELTPLKRRARRRCRDDLRSGGQLGLYCVGSSVGLMLLLLAAGAMSVVWMTAVTALVLAQKVFRPHPAFDLAIAATIAALGLLILFAPSSVPGLVPPM
jgi:predicted metal-binding membrane protein